MNTKTIDWELIVERSHTSLFLDFLFSSQSINLMQETVGLDFAFTNIKKNDLSLSYDKEQNDHARSVVRKSWDSHGKHTFIKFEELCQHSCLALKSYSAASLSNLTYQELSNNELHKLFHDYCEMMIRHFCFIQSLSIFQEELLEIINDELAFVGKENLDIIDLLIPSEDSEKIKSIKNLLELGRLIQEDKTIENEIKSLSIEDLISLLPTTHPEIWSEIKLYIERYFWMGRSYFRGSGLSEFEVLDRLKTTLNEDCQNKINTLEKLKRNKEEKRRTLILEDIDSEKISPLLVLLEKYLYLKDYRLEIVFIAHESVVPLLNEIANRINLKYDDVIFYTRDELKQKLIGKESAAFLVNLERRKSKLNALMVSNKVEWDSQSPDSQDDGLSIKEIENHSFEGTICCPGKASGKACIVLSPNDASRMERGDILITTMPLPEILYSVEKAGAIVTSEGGVLKHAAIISREMNIPCISGVQAVTSLIKDGELITVDANSGVVSRNNP